MTTEQILAFMVAFFNDSELIDAIDFSVEMGVLLDDWDVFDLKHFVYEACRPEVAYHYEEVSYEVYGFIL